MKGFKEYFLSKYGKSVSELSATSDLNRLIDDVDFKMISLDEISKLKRYKINGDEFSTADALFITENNGKPLFKIFEFKNMNFADKKDRLMAEFHLKKFIKHVNECEYGCKLANDKSNFHKYLVDKSKVSLRVKPIESISLIYLLLKDYYKNQDINVEETLFNVTKQYFIVSKTNNELNSPFSKNKSNTRRKPPEFFRFLYKLKPFYYSQTYAINDITFKKYLNYFNDN